MTFSASQIVQMEKPVYGGACLARIDGKAVFVPLTLPGERVRVRIVEEKRGYATAECEEIVVAVPERIAPACRHFGSCGGCHYQHTDYATQLRLKQAILRETLERGGVRAAAEIAVLAGQPWGYRNRIRLAADAAGRLGYRGRRSHAVVPVSECPIAAPLLMQAAVAIAEAAQRCVPKMRLSEVALYCNAEETALLASVLAERPVKCDFDAFARDVMEHVPALRGAELVMEGHTGGSARVLARWGDAAITYCAAGFEYRVDHGAFFQVNRWLVDALVERVIAGQRGALAWDLFAGVGLFARQLAKHFARVVAVESAPAAMPALEANLRGTAGTAVRAETLDFLKKMGTSERPDLIVVDPPRTGLGKEITALLGALQAPAMTYVSCDPATLARDLRALVAADYVIESVTMADLFPQTFHLETVVQLRRA